MKFNYPYHNYHTFPQDYSKFMKEVGELEIIQKSEKTSYYNVAAAFDIETSSTIVNNTKFATMYIWQFGINGSVIVGREWYQFSQLMNLITKDLGLSKNKRLIIYVHNLSYEFQFINKRIKWAKDSNGSNVIFSLEKRRPIYALADNGMEFRCSYFLSNCSLSYIGAEMLFKYPVQKAVGDLDYSKVCTSKTPLTPEEMTYCINDVRVLMSYIQEKIENENGLVNLPLTNTGYVRKYTRDYCTGAFNPDPDLGRKQGFEYRAIMRALKIQSEKEYAQLKSAFAGGFTHGSPLKVRKLLKNVGSADLTSSYPYTMVSDYFPMSSGTFIGHVEYPEHFRKLISQYCCLFTVTFKGLYQIFPYESYISVSKCVELSSDYISQNGRLCEASLCTINITELDWDIIDNIYSWDEIEINNMRIYDKGYLPREFIMSILELYKSKTTLKGVENKEVEYLIKKGMLNSAYGMCVTDIVRDDAIFIDGEWDSVEADAFSQLNHYNKSYTRFLFYPWGVWVTAHARHNLWKAIFEFGADYVYADTDSIKGTNFDSHQFFFDKYNFHVKTKLMMMCDYYNIPYEMIQPKTKKGEPKLLGVWEREADYAYFKTLGAKRYMYEYANGHDAGLLNMTVSGVNKNYAIPFLLHKFCGFDYNLCKLAYTTDPRQIKERDAARKQLVDYHKSKSYNKAFKAFDCDLVIPPGYSGKSIHTYVDVSYTAMVTDYLGNTSLCTELSYTHLEPTGYQFSMAENYLKYLNGTLLVED